MKKDCQNNERVPTSKSQDVPNLLSDTYVVLPANTYQTSFMHENTESFDVTFYILYVL